MFYFIPAWYNKEHPWYENEDLHREFDDTINQVRIFKKAGEPIRLLVLNYMPHLRHLLHRQDLLTTSTWSLFDEIQGFGGNEIERILDFREFNWPVDAEFIYTPFSIVVRRRNANFAQIKLNEAGKLYKIDYFEGNRKTYQFDDRGFLSSVMYYEKDSTALYRDYVDKRGQWCIREHFNFAQKIIEVNPHHCKVLSKLYYDNMQEVVQELVGKYSEQFDAIEDKIMIASHLQHNELLLEQFKNYKCLLSFFGERYPLNQVVQTHWLQHVFMMVVDTQQRQRFLQKQLPLMSNKITHLPPYDTRLQLGTSQRLKQLKICLVVDGINDAILDALFIFFANMMAENKKIDLLLISRYEQSMDNYEEKLSAILDDFEIAIDEEDNLLEKTDEDVPWYEERLSFESAKSEQDIMLAFEKVRIIVDLQDSPDVFMQIAGISSGIPQINLCHSQYVEHLKNGYIIQDLSELPKALDYYLIGLQHWNEALVYSVKQLLKYTDDQLVAEWKKIGEDT